MVYTDNESYSVDTEEDLKNVINKMKSDNLLKKRMRLLLTSTSFMDTPKTS